MRTRTGSYILRLSTILFLQSQQAGSCNIRSVDIHDGAFSVDRNVHRSILPLL